MNTVHIMDTLPKTQRFENVLFNFYQSVIDHFIKHKNFNQAEVYYKKVSQNQHFNSVYGILLQIRYALARDDIEEAGKLINNAPPFLSDTSSIYQLRFTNQRATYFEKTKNHEKALIDFKKVKELELKQDKEKILKYAGFLQSRLDIQEQKNKIQILEKENELHSFRRWFYGLGILGFAIMGFFLFFLYRQSLKKNKLLASHSKLIQEQSKKIKKEAIIKQNLFENISHELRTPLTLIASPINKLLNESLSGSIDQKSLELISNYSNQLLNLTNQILDLSKNKLKKVKINLYSFRLENMLIYLKNEFELKASRQNVQLIFINDLNTKTSIVTDVEKLITILKNILVNALKYSKETGVITVTSSIKSEVLKINISDQGIGISEEALPYIFDRFYQSSEISPSRGGVGLGLAISKEYITMLSGKITTKSIQEVGTNFSIEIPIKTYSKELEYLPPFEFPQSYYEEPNILPQVDKNYLDKDYLLIVEDNIDLCQHLNEILKRDYLISFAHNGNEALKQIEQVSPKIIITDWMMPSMDGEEFITHLKAKKNYSSIPILMLTARNLPENRLSILRIGIDMYLTKPFIQETLKSHINHLVELADKRLSDATKADANVSGFSQDDLKFLKDLEKITLENISDFNFILSTISNALKISPRQLNRKVKILTGLTPKQYVNEVRYQEAKRMLESREHSTVKAVIYSVGFKAEQNFSRNFKKRFGKYPKEILQ